MNALKIFNKLPNFLVAISLTLLQQNVFAQKFYERNEYGLMAGASQYFGDLNPEYGFNSVRPAVGAFYRYYFNPYISLRAGINYTHLTYKDSYSSNPYQKVRNLSFNNDVVEAMVLGEFNFFYFMTGVEGRRVTPYMVLGLGALYSNPYVNYNGRRQYLKGIGTEGQFMEEYKDRRYNKLNVIAPFGAGIKTWLAPGINFGFEVVHRFAFTDYLDDVSTNYVGEHRFLNPNGTATTASILQDPSISNNGTKLGIAGKQRGDKASIDQYLMAQITLSFQLKTYRCPSEHPLWNQ